jgi:phage gp46-like protein
MDFAITIPSVSSAGSPEPVGQMTFDAVGDIGNNIYLSLAVEKGSFFHRPEFGLRRRGRLKNTAPAAALIRQDYLDALRWLVDTGRAKSVEVFVERDRRQDLNRLKVLIEAVQADGRTVTFTTFREVV